LEHHPEFLRRVATVWSAAGMLFLVYTVPGFTTPMYYLQTDTLKFSQPFIGTSPRSESDHRLTGFAERAVLEDASPSLDRVPRSLGRLG
jgi:hypothetical protein